jgi:ferric-dicitrate binding protein FerR (iron transport regulator)
MSLYHATLLMGKEQKEYVWNLVARKLAGEATADELRELEKLLRNNPELHYPLQTITDLWKQVGSNTAREIEQAEKAFSAHLNRMTDLKMDLSPAITEEQFIRPVRFHRRRIAVIGFAATLLLVIIGAGGWLFRRAPQTHPAISAIPDRAPANKTNDVATSNGSRMHLNLPDGTGVWLNAGSHIDYPKDFGATRREVNLTGEAFFDVAADVTKPFVIHAKKIDVLVLGTAFNVKSYPADKTTEATLVRGSIQVYIHNRPNDKIILKPNEKLVIPNDDSLPELPRARSHSTRASALTAFVAKPTFEEHTGAMIETSWVDNKLIFQDEDFTELARQMERWYGVMIRFDEPRLGQLQFTGIFEKETIRQALDALRLTASFDYTINGTEITIHN